MAHISKSVQTLIFRLGECKVILYKLRGELRSPTNMGMTGLIFEPSPPTPISTGFRVKEISKMKIFF